MWWMQTEVFILLLWLINLKKIITISARDKIWRNAPQEKDTGKKVNDRCYPHIVQQLGTDIARVESSWYAPVRSIHPPPEGLLANWAWSGLGREQMIPTAINPRREKAGGGFNSWLSARLDDLLLTPGKGEAAPSPLPSQQGGRSWHHEG
jgi:hypothetical protein